MRPSCSAIIALAVIFYCLPKEDYRLRFESLSDEFKLVKDVGDATKHSILTVNKENRALLQSKDVQFKPHSGGNLFTLPFGEPTFNNGSIYVKHKAGHEILLSEQVNKVVNFFKHEIKQIEIEMRNMSEISAKTSR